MVSGDLPRRLLDEAKRAEASARAAGLDFFEVVFELLDASDVNAIAAYGGFPTRYPSWRFGMDFERLQKGYGYGLSKVYELVINNDPTVAYLVRSNSLMASSSRLRLSNAAPRPLRAVQSSGSSVTAVRNAFSASS